MIPRALMAVPLTRAAYVFLHAPVPGAWQWRACVDPGELAALTPTIVPGSIDQILAELPSCSAAEVL